MRRSETHTISWLPTDWLEMVQELGTYNDGKWIGKGKLHYNDGRISQLLIQPGIVNGTVECSKDVSCEVTLITDRIPEEDWDRIVQFFASQAQFTAQLLQGVIPSDLRHVCQQNDIEIFPNLVSMMNHTCMQCTCDVQLNPCEHIFAILLAMVDEFDQDPFVWF